MLFLQIVILAILTQRFTQFLRQCSMHTVWISDISPLMDINDQNGKQKKKKEKKKKTNPTSFQDEGVKS